MALPDNATGPWPPPKLDAVTRCYREWAAWWSGDVTELSRVYSTAVGFGDPVVSAADRRGLVALAPRSFHGAPPARGGLQSVKLHIPLASDIAMTSADLLFGEPPALVAAKDDADTRNPATVVRTSPVQQRLDFYMANGLQAALMEAAEIAAAFGGVFLRVGWDAEVADHPLFDAIAPDAAVPEFRSGQLVAVTFHRVLPDTGDGYTWRHLERHESGPGRILHGLYRSGDDKTLGVRRPLAEHPETQMFARLVGSGDTIETGAKGLAVEYVPNMRPQRRMRGSQLGRSDFDGIVPVMDALDESWSSWMRDLRLGKGRVMVPEVYLDGQGRGQGALFDLEQEVFQVVNALPGATGLALTQVQFNIRVAEHQQTCAALTEQAVRGAGYSAQTFGMQGDGGMATATEVNARQSRSFMTRGKKINYWRPPLARLARAALEIDVKQFRPQAVSAGMLPDVEWPDGIAVDPQTLAQTLQLLKGAEAASTRTRVELLHADWDDERVEKEVKLIEAEGAPPAGPDIGPPGATVGNTAGQPAGGGAETGERPPAATRPDPAASGTGQKPATTTPAPAPPAPSRQPAALRARPAARAAAARR